MPPLLRKASPIQHNPFDPPAVRPLAEDAEYAKAVALLKALRGRDERRQQELELLSHQAYFDGKMSTADGPRDKAQRKRMEMLSSLPSYFDTASTDPAPTAIPAPALARGLELLRGGVVEPEMTRQQKLDRLHRDGLILVEAIQYQAGEVDRIRDERSAEVCEHLRAHHDAILLAFFRACQALAALSDCERSFRSAILIAGFDARPDIISPPFISAPLLLGSESVWDSQISSYRLHLQEKGIIS